MRLNLNETDFFGLIRLILIHLLFFYCNRCFTNLQDDDDDVSC